MVMVMDAALAKKAAQIIAMFITVQRDAIHFKDLRLI